MYRYALYAVSRCGRTLYRKIKKQGSQRKGIRKMVDGMKPPKINRPIATKPMAFCLFRRFWLKKTFTAYQMM